MPISIFQQERCFHFFIGQFVFVVKHVSIVPQENIFLQESLFPTFHRKAIFSTKACFIFTQENMFLFLHKEASFHMKPISVFILESLFLFYIGKLVSQECMFPFFYRKAHFRFSIRKLCFHFSTGKPVSLGKPFFYLQESQFSCLHRKAIFLTKACFHFTQESLFLVLHRKAYFRSKACFHVSIEEHVSTFIQESLFPQKSLFPFFHGKACFNRKFRFHIGKSVFVGNLFPSKVLIHAEVQTFMFCNFRCSYCIICSYTSMFRLNSLHISFS